MSPIIQNGEFRDPLSHAFSYLNPETLNTASQVCKVWKQVGNAESLWQKIAKEKGVEDLELSRKELIQLSKMEKSLEKGEIVFQCDLKGNHNETICTLIYLNGQLFTTSCYKINIWEKHSDKSYHLVQTIPIRHLVADIESHNGQLIIHYADFKGTTEVYKKNKDQWNLLETKTHGHRIPMIPSTNIGNYSVHGLFTFQLIATHKRTHDSHEIETTPKEKRHTQPISSLLYLDGTLITGALDGTVKVWGPKA